jgi:hypothetical protein
VRLPTLAGLLLRTVALVGISEWKPEFKGIEAGHRS